MNNLKQYLLTTLLPAAIQTLTSVEAASRTRSCTARTTGLRFSVAYMRSGGRGRRSSVERHLLLQLEKLHPTLSTGVTFTPNEGHSIVEMCMMLSHNVLIDHHNSNTSITSHELVSILQDATDLFKQSRVGQDTSASSRDNPTAYGQHDS